MIRLFRRELICVFISVVFVLSASTIFHVNISNEGAAEAIYLSTINDDELIAPSEITFTGDIPERWDWRDVNGEDWTTPIKDQIQDQCGSCWAFGSLAALESTIKLWKNNSTMDVDLSEQYMVSCSPGDCDGWYWFNTLNWIKSNGAIPETCFEYSADDSILCDEKCGDWKNHVIGIENYHRVSSDVTSIQNALITYGPLATNMDVYGDLYPEFDGGVYRYTNGDYVFGHIVSIVGYDNTWGSEDEGYWIVKNSWGSEWGEEGWFRIAYGECNIEKNTYYYTGPNYPPTRPEAPSGPSRLNADEPYNFSAVTDDVDSDSVRFCFDWGDGNVSWSDFVLPNADIVMEYSWEEKGDYLVRVKAKDEHGLESEWSPPLPITVPASWLDSVNDFRTLILTIIENIFGFAII